MDYEKKYKDALIRAREVHRNEADKRSTMEFLFPELKESEDEKIRKFISNELVCLRATYEKGSDRYNELTEAITWLEKQGEQKSADKVEPKFNVGDTIIKRHNSYIHDFGSFTITDIAGDKYWYNDRIICNITEQDEWELYEPVRQKLAWSEKDEVHLKDAIYAAKELYSHNCGVEELVDWLQTLKDRVQPQPRKKWNEEDETD